MLLKEIKLPELRTKATSNLTAKHLNARYDNDYYYTVTFAFVQLKGNLVSRFSRFLRGAQNTPNTLTVLYTVNATFGDGKSVPNNIYPSEPNKYHVVIQFQNIQVAEQASGLKWTQFLSAPDQKKQQMIQTVINSCDVKLYSDDPSFYWQGVHEVLDKHGIALYPFRGTPGDGQWEARHKGSGGLSGNIYVTKHIAQISEQISSDWRDIVKSIQQNQSIQESFNYDYILSKRLSENTLNYKYIFQEAFEITERCMLSEISVDTFVRRISTNLIKKIPAEQAGGVYGTKYAERAIGNTLEPISLVTKDPSMQNANMNHFTKDRPDINTKLIEAMYKDTCGQLKNNQQYVRKFFESFVIEVKKVGILFTPSAILNIA